MFQYNDAKMNTENEMGSILKDKESQLQEVISKNEKLEKELEIEKTSVSSIQVCIYALS